VRGFIGFLTGFIVGFLPGIDGTFKDGVVGLVTGFGVPTSGSLINACTPE
jgi:hypothetical protein